ncbi:MULTISPECIES: hypothetical protein [unclassified Saccharopolyspora]|uniref:hypothetical protein n=1 Tax=unclassified Saccharopolyspora TaxID=2646250 RepID=UPI001CD541E6|nr:MULTISPECIES: hypothetical protein [unclassified Saccharopolyspora]MCA1225319.1 hypothetical protein [Saccharopolyspora sp. 6M]MCA1278889.1 hypothetical protein [Saccharopolyspora sp. 7B]
MRIRTDDEVYRVDAVWLGPPKATFPWRARYVAWGVGTVVFLLVLAIERRMNIGFGFFSTGWAVVLTILVTRIVCSRITHERPLGAVMVMWLRELTAPRERTTGSGGAAGAARLKVRAERPRPKQKQSGRAKKSARRGRPTPARQTRRTNRVQQGTQPTGGATRQVRRPRKSAERTRSAGGRARSKEVRGVRSPSRR